MAGRPNRHKELRDKRIAAGLCGSCLSPALPNRTLCQKHLTSHREIYNKMRDRRIDAGLCVQCGAIAVLGKHVCQKHFEGQIKRSNEHVAKRKAVGGCRYCSAVSLSGKLVCETHFLQQQEYNKQWYAVLKKQVIAGYGGKCQCPGGCDESRFQFLTVDHVNNDGAEQRRKLGNKEFGSALYQRLIAQNFPDDYQLLCYNCNCAKGFYGECPHIAENRLAHVAAGGE